MLSGTRFVGVDDHRQSVQVCVMDANGQTLANRSVGNRWPAIVAVLEETVGDGEAQRTVRASIESCSGAAHRAEELIGRTG